MTQSQASLALCVVVLWDKVCDKREPKEAQDHARSKEYTSINIKPEWNGVES